MLEQLRTENVHLLESLSAQKKIELGLRERLRSAEEAKAAIVEEARRTLNEVCPQPPFIARGGTVCPAVPPLSLAAPVSCSGCGTLRARDMRDLANRLRPRLLFFSFVRLLRILLATFSQQMTSLLDHVTKQVNIIRAEKKKLKEKATASPSAHESTSPASAPPLLTSDPIAFACRPRPPTVFRPSLTP